jgi:integrase
MKVFPLPKNVDIQDGRLYFRKRHKNQWYRGAFGLVDSKANRKTAKHIVSEIDASMKRGTFDPNNFVFLSKYHSITATGRFPTFAEYADTWLDRKKQLAPATFRTYKSLVEKHLTPHFGAMPVNEITKLVIERWQAQAVNSISRTYSNDCLRRLRSILYEAMDDYGFENRLKRIKPLQSYEVEDTIEDKMFTMEEASSLYYVMGTRLRTMMLCSMLAGLRTGEVIALKREDINFERNYLHVRATMSEGLRKRPKSRAGNRKIKMHGALRQHLVALLASHDNEFVFISQRGNPITCRQNFQREYNLVKEKAGVRSLRWYAFRKLFASIRYACEDAVPGQIANDMGHTDIALTLNTYAEAMPHFGCKFEQVAFPLEPDFLKVEQRKTGTVAG